MVLKGGGRSGALEGSIVSTQWSQSLSEEKGDSRVSVGVLAVEHLKAAE
jgi:hypothetical protein